MAGLVGGRCGGSGGGGICGGGDGGGGERNKWRYIIIYDYNWPAAPVCQTVRAAHVKYMAKVETQDLYFILTHNGIYIYILHEP